MAFQIRFAGLTIDGIEDWSEDSPSRIRPESFPRRHGSIVPAVSFLGPRLIRVSGEVFKDTQSALTTYLEDLTQTLTEKGRDKLYRYDDTRFLNASKSGFSYGFNSRRVATLGARFGIEFIADDPFWYSETGSSGGKDPVSVSPDTFAVTNSGKAKTPPFFEITKLTSAGTGTYRLENSTTGIFVQYIGTLNTNGMLEIDCANHTVRANSANALPSFTGSLANNELIQGVNNFSYSGPVPVKIRILWVHRWA